MIHIIDTTLRERQKVRTLNEMEKIHMASLLDRLGVYQLEIGIPGIGGAEKHAVTAIVKMGLKSRISTWNRPLLGDLRASLACGVHNLHISAPVSDVRIHDELGKNRLWVLDTMKRALRYAFDYGCLVTVGAEDASRADPSFLLEFAFLAQEMGAERFRYCDTGGLLDPSSTVEQIAWLQENLNMELEFHGHNDGVTATINALVASKMGVRYLNTSFRGAGGLPGRNLLEQLVLTLDEIGVHSADRQDWVLQLMNIYARQVSHRAVC